VTLTYAYLVSWILGGLGLLTMVVMRTQLRPYWLAVAPMSFGATGFLLLGSGLAPLAQIPIYAAVAALLGATLGLGLDRLGRRDVTLSARTE